MNTGQKRGAEPPNPAPETKQNSKQGISHSSAEGKPCGKHFGYLIRCKKVNAKGPDMRGEIVINGHLYRLGGWLRVSKKGKKYLNLVAEIALQQ